MSKEMNDLPIDWVVTIELQITWGLIYKIIQATAKRQKLRIRYTFEKNPFYGNQDMTVNEFWKIAYLGKE